MKPRILIVEDDPKIAALVSKNLEAAGYACHEAPSGEDGLEALQRVQPLLVILDVTLPGIDGHEFTRRARRTSNVPIIMLTARVGDSDKVLGFEIGADDYVTKPFSTQELVARVRALLRRSSYEPHDSVLVRGGLSIDAERREVRIDGELVETTSLEFDLLHFIASRPGRVYSRESLMNQVWGHDRVVDTRSIDSIVSRLRRKLEPDPGRPRYIQTVWGAGYRFAESPPSQPADNDASAPQAPPSDGGADPGAR
jgi:DNA-binding response OmpR family regulator